MGFNLDDYEPVASRLDRFLKAHPDARVITDLVLEAVAYMHSMSKMAEVIRHANYTETRSQLNNVVRFITGTDNE